MQSPTLLVSDWKKYELPFANYLYDGNLKKLDKPRSNVFFDNDFEFALRLSNNYNQENKSPLQQAFEKYKANPDKYNKKKTYVQDLNNISKELTT